MVAYSPARTQQRSARYPTYTTKIAWYQPHGWKQSLHLGGLTTASEEFILREPYLGHDSLPTFLIKLREDHIRSLGTNHKRHRLSLDRPGAKAVS